MAFVRRHLFSTKAWFLCIPVAMAAPASAQFQTQLDGSVQGGSQPGIQQTFTNVPVAVLTGLRQHDKQGNSAESHGSLTTLDGEVTLSTHACSGGMAGFSGSAQASASGLVDIYYRISAPTLPAGTPISVSFRWAIAARVTAVGEDVTNVMDSGQASAAGAVALFVNDGSFFSGTGSYSRQIGSYVSFGDLDLRGGDSGEHTVTALLGQTLRVRMLGALSANTFAFGPASTDGDAQLSMVWGVTSLTPNATVVLYGDPDEPAPSADGATMDRADELLPPRPVEGLPCFRIPEHPESVFMCAGDTATYSVATDGAGPFTYRWEWMAPTIMPGWSDIVEGLNVDPMGRPVFIATAAMEASVDFVLAPDTPYSYDDWNAIIVRVVISNDCGELTSDAASLTVYAPASISEQPSDTSACAGGDAAFAVTVVGSGPFTYQWRMNGEPISLVDNPTATSAMLTIHEVRPEDEGVYDVVVANACGSVESETAMLTICLADFNCNGVANSQDFFEFLGAFFAGNADFNGDDATNSQDFFDFLAAFFEGC